MTLMLPQPSRILGAIDLAVLAADLVPGTWHMLPLRHNGCGGVWQITRRTEITGYPTFWGTTRCSRCQEHRPIAFPLGGRPALVPDGRPSPMQGDPR